MPYNEAKEDCKVLNLQSFFLSNKIRKEGIK